MRLIGINATLSVVFFRFTAMILITDYSSTVAAQKKSQSQGRPQFNTQSLLQSRHLVWCPLTVTTIHLAGSSEVGLKKSKSTEGRTTGMDCRMARSHSGSPDAHPGAWLAAGLGARLAAGLGARLAAESMLLALRDTPCCGGSARGQTAVTRILCETKVNNGAQHRESGCRREEATLQEDINSDSVYCASDYCLGEFVE
jgi:hypothetical protein